MSSLFRSAVRIFCLLCAREQWEHPDRVPRSLPRCPICGGNQMAEYIEKSVTEMRLVSLPPADVLHEIYAAERRRVGRPALHPRKFCVDCGKALGRGSRPRAKRCLNCHRHRRPEVTWTGTRP